MNFGDRALAIILWLRLKIYFSASISALGLFTLRVYACSLLVVLVKTKN
jgi:hypothetical protein